MRIPNGISAYGLCILAALAPGCTDDPESLRAEQSAIAPNTITFDESGLPAGTVITNQFAPQGLILSAPANALVRIVDDAIVGSFPTASGDFYLAINTNPAVPPGAVVTGTFVNACGQPAITDTLSLFATDTNPVPNPRVAIRSFDAGGALLETRTLGSLIAQLTFNTGGIARIELDDLGGDGHLIDDIAIAPIGDPDDDLFCADLKVQIAQSLLVVNSVRVSNLGADAAPNVTLHIDLPTGLVLSSFGGSGWSCVVVAGDLDCTRPALAAGAQAPALTFVVVPLPLPSTLSATVGSDADDPDPANNSASAPIPGRLL